MKKGLLKRYFLTGLFVLIPFGAAGLIVTWLFNLLDAWAHPITERFLGHHIPGLGFVITAAVILGVGALSSNVIGRWFLKWFDTLGMELPVFRTIYGTTKQMLAMLAPDAEKSFQSVVLVEYPHTGSLSLGFVTHELRLDPQGQGVPHLSVYLPTNHFYLGDTFIVPASKVRRTQLTVQQGIQSVISAGTTLPTDLPTTAW